MSEQTTIAPVTAEEWVCPSCGKTNNSSFAFCENCGTKKPAPQAAQQEPPQTVPQKQAPKLTDNAKKKLLFVGLPTAVCAVIAVVCVINAAISMSDHAAEKKSYDAFVARETEKAEEAVEELDAQIALLDAEIEGLNAKAADYQTRIEECAQNEQKLEDDIVKFQQELADIDALKAENSDLKDDLAALKAEQEALGGDAGKFITSPDYNTAEYAKEQIASIMNTQQDMIYQLKTGIVDHITLLYKELGISSAADTSSLYPIEPPEDIGKELAEEVIGVVAGAYGSEIADFAGGVATEMVNGSDLSTALDTKIKDTINSKIKGAQDDILDAATGGLYSSFTEAADAVEKFTQLYNKLTDSTPNYCLRYICADMQQSINKMTAFVDDDNISVEDMEELISALNRLHIMEESYKDIAQSTNGFTSDYYSGELSDIATNVYCQLVVDNENLVYYFALMEG
ncbi:MAG: hypothetical protein E7478_00510 [Ruminococcaceae bacterium]|nr:hypothetical protein [Oscillospiraceae bacterium]